MDGAIWQVPWRFPAKRFEGELVVGADVAFLLDEEQFVVGLIGRQKANPLVIQRVAGSGLMPPARNALARCIVPRPIG